MKFLSIILSALLPFCLSAQNVTIKKNANSDNLIWPLNSSQSIYIGEGTGNVSTGLFNTGIGAFSLNLNTTASSNTAIGNVAMAKVTTGGLNTALGVSAMYEHLTGTENTAIGMSSLYNNKGRSRSTAVGYKAMYYANNATSAGSTFNTAVGYEALNGSPSPASNTGIKNTVMGDQAMYANTSGFNNTAYGFNSAYSNTTGNTNSAFGAQALYSNTTGFSNVAIGNLSLYSNTTRRNLVAIGDSALYKNGIGATQFYEAIYNTAVGTKTLAANTTGYQNTAVGAEVMFKNTTGSNNTAMGSGAMYNTLTGSLNTAIGNRAMLSNTIGGENTASGYSAMQLNSTGNYNVAVGKEALYSNSAGHRNVALGYEAGKTNTGSGNVFIGHKAGTAETEDDRLYIDNAGGNMTQALIYGEFDSSYIRANAHMDLFCKNVVNDGLYVNMNFPSGTNSLRAAIRANNTVDDGYGTGVLAYGGSVGVYGATITNGSNPNTIYSGVYGQSYGNNPGTNIGVKGLTYGAEYNYGGSFAATGSLSVNIGVDATGSGAPVNYGGYFRANNGENSTGLDVTASGASSVNTAVLANATGNSGTKIGINAFADGTGTNYAVKAQASGGTTNYAGYFDGKTYVSNYFGVGVNPTYEIHVKQAGLASTNGIRSERNDNTNNWVTNIDGSDDYNFYYNGALKGYIRDSDGVYVTNSDRRLKQDIEPISSVLGNLLQLNPSKYYYIDAGSAPSTKSNGFIAQEVQTLFPEVVAEKNGYLGISYESMIPIAIKAIQEQQVIIDAQEARIAKLEALVQDLIAKEK